MSYRKLAALTAALTLLAAALVAGVARGRVYGPQHHKHATRFIAQHTNIILRRKCLPTYGSLAGGRRLWLYRHLLSHRAKRHRCTPPAPAVDACLSSLIWRESKGDVHATNHKTGAYGIPQALPGSKMASAGPDWRDSRTTQIRWMIGYIGDRYHGSSCEALNFQIAHDWY